MADFSYLQQQLDDLAEKGLLRSLRNVNSPCSTTVKINGKEKILFCSNDYLSLAADKQICAVAKKSIDSFGFGSAASRLISGNICPHGRLEKKLATLFNKPSALLFSTGFMANLAVLQTLPQKDDLVLLDKLNHASIIDAAKSGNAEFRTYHRRQFEKIEKYLASDKYERKFIVTESIFSMDGDAAELEKLVRLKTKYKNTFLIVDEAHAFGCLGKNGAGLAQQLGLGSDVDVIVATLSKAAGCMGGVVAAGKTAIDYIINKARPFIYTTAPVICNSAAAFKAIEIIEQAEDKRAKLKENSEYLRSRLKSAGFNTADSCSHIVPVIIGDNQKTVRLSEKLFDAGFLVVAIRPPTVPPATSRLRISVQSAHSRKQIDGLCDCLEKFRHVL